MERDGAIGFHVLGTFYMSVCSTYGLHSIASIRGIERTMIPFIRNEFN